MNYLSVLISLGQWAQRRVDRQICERTGEHDWRRTKRGESVGEQLVHDAVHNRACSRCGATRLAQTRARKGAKP